MIRRCFVLLLIFVPLFMASCSSAPDIEELLVGSWRMRRANIHSVQSYRHNKSWVEQERVEGKFSRIVETKEKVEGEWTTEYTKDQDKIFIVITPSVVSDNDTVWVKDKPARFEVLEINKDELILKNEAGQVNTWTRVKSSQSGDGETDMGIASINPGALVVNLKLDRAQEKFRFLCLDLEMSVEDPEGITYIGIEKDPDTQVATYHLHPVIMDTMITFFSSQTYKSIKSLDKVKDVVNDLRVVLNPYFKGRLTDIKVNKVVVTANPESVVEFQNLYAEEHGLAPLAPEPSPAEAPAETSPEPPPADAEKQ